jgi:serine/threonine protein kinase
MRLEIDTMSKLSHSNIFSIVEAYSLQGQSYLAMEFCFGGNHAGHIPMSESQAIKVTVSLVQVVD